MDELTLTLHHPLTDKEWDDITDVDFEHTNEITFYTKNGKEVVFAKKPHWIPVLEALPEEAGDYLCTCTDARRLLVSLVKWQPKMKSWNLSGARTYWKVIAWMPLPSPYKTEEE